MAIRLTAEGKLTVRWKNQILVDALDTGYAPRPGRMVLGARTAGSNQHTHVDNLRLETLAPTQLATGFIPGMVWFNQWRNQTGSFATFASQNLGNQLPTLSDLRNGFYSGTDLGEQYFGQMVAWFTPTVTDSYVFLCAGDDLTELYLSTDDTPGRKVKIAGVPGWTDPRQWNKYPEQKSAPITLTAGRSYYLELLWKEDFGGDHGSVAVKRASEADPVNGRGELTGSRIGTYVRGALPLNLAIARNGASAVITWSGGSNPRLHSARSVSGPWTEVIGASSPYVTSMDGSARFFVLRDGSRVSPTTVAYINLPVVAGYNLLANPLNSGANRAAEVFPDAPDGTTLFKLTAGTEQFRSNVKFFGRFTDESSGYPPGTGLYVHSPAAVTLSMVGEVPQGNLAQPLARGPNLIASQVPQVGKLQSDLGYSPTEGDLVFRYSAASQGFTVPSGHDFGAWTFGEPSLALGEAFVLHRPSAGAWIRTFTVKP